MLHWLRLTFCLATLTSAFSLAAQTTMSFRTDGETVLTPGLPFQAERITRVQHKLLDGNEISREEHETIARDADGRYYNESKLTSSGGNSLPNTGIFHLVIDPTTHTTLTWSTFSQVALSGRIGSSSHLVVTTLQPHTDETAHLPKNSSIITTQDLGKKTIAGLVATGSRTITTIPAGVIGNARDIVLTHDVWISTDLQITISESDDSPISGTRTAEMTTITRTVPSPELFQLPSGYTIKAQAFPGGGVMGGISSPTPAPAPH
jgi:hypothetical protein